MQGLPSRHGPDRRPAAGAVVLSAALALLVAAACVRPDAAAWGPAGSPALRAALFDTIVARVQRREAFSEVKQRNLGFDPLADMLALRAAVVAADTEESLFRALVRLSHARRDRHLNVALVPDGLRLSDAAGVDAWGLDAVPAPHAPIRILPDYGASGGWFVADVARDPAVADGPVPGDRVIELHDMPVDDWAAAAAPYIRHSTQIGLRWKLAEAMTERTAVLPPALGGATLRMQVAAGDGGTRRFELPYRAAHELTWAGHAEPRYPGLSRVRATPTWDLLRPDDGRRFLVLVWYGFRETMVEDVDSLVALAARERLLDHALVIDVTRSRGGSRGPYALQRLQSRPFRTTFGNLRLSDVTEPFIAARHAAYDARRVTDGGVPETMDGGAWQMDWLATDVRAALARGDAYTAAVPFKLAHAPKDGDGVLPPAPLHFRGPLAVIAGPNGGSHLDQFLAIIADNRLGPIVGMPAGGFSNTWEWEETLVFPGTDRPVVGFMYSIGHTLRPNGQVLEGNPAAVDVWLPLTAAGFDTYYARLLEAALARLGPWQAGSRDR